MSWSNLLSLFGSAGGAVGAKMDGTNPMNGAVKGAILTAAPLTTTTPVAVAQMMPKSGMTQPLGVPGMGQTGDVMAQLQRLMKFHGGSL